MKFLSTRKLWSTLSLLCAFAVCATLTFAQDKDWRPISPAELSAKAPVVEPGADAEAIFWEVRIDDSGSEDVVLRHYVRVKIFTEAGREKYSKFDIPFTKSIKIKDLAARVTKPDGTSTEIGPNDIFEREIVKAGGVKVKAKSFAVPNIEPGVIVEYRYKETFLDSGARGMRLAFQRDLPVQNLSYYYKPYNSREPSYQSYNFTDVKFVKDQKGYWLATKTNVPSFKEEARMPPEDTIRPWMLLTGANLEITNVTMMGFQFMVKDPSSPVKYWGAVATEYSGLVKLMTKGSGDIKKVSAEITAGAATPGEKLSKIYEFCQTQIRNTTFDTTLTDEDRKKLSKTNSLNDVLKQKTGNAMSIDLLFGALASAAGLETRLALSGHRGENFFRPEMTNDRLVHPAAIAVNLGGDKWRFFNPGTPFLPNGMLVWYEEDTWALLVGEKSYSWERTPLSEYAQSQTKREGKFRLSEDGTLEGTVRIEYTGHPAITYRLDKYEDSANKREEDLKADLKEHFSTAEITAVKIENLMDSSKPLVHEYSIRVPSYAQKTGKRLFFQPGIFEFGEQPLFAGAARKYDIFFRYPWSERDTITVDLPAGYELDSADTPGAIADAQKIGSLDITMTHNKTANRLGYDRKFYFGGGGNVLFPVSAYGALKGLFDAFQKSEAHTITLRQK